MKQISIGEVNTILDEFDDQWPMAISSVLEKYIKKVCGDIPDKYVSDIGNMVINEITSSPLADQIRGDVAKHFTEVLIVYKNIEFVGERTE